MVARMLGKHIEVSELLDNQNVSSNGGSTLADLCRMIDGQGFERQVLADARTSGQFENNHIPLAISLPIDTSFWSAWCLAATDNPMASWW